MTNLKRVIIILSLFFLFSCEKRKNKTKIEINSKAKVAQKSLKALNRIHEIESLSFRRTYVEHENLSDKELDGLYKTNPSLENYNKNSDIVRKLNDKKLLKNAELILSNFENKRVTKEYLDTDKKIEITCDYDPEYLSKINLKVTKKNKSDFKTLDFQGDHILGVVLKDIDDDGVKEILILTNYYIMNGDNFVITILKYI